MATDSREILDILRAADPSDPALALTLSWPALERIRARGGVVVVKLDGERGPSDNGAYTVVISGRLLGENFVRVDADTLADALHSALSRCPADVWA